MAKTNKQTSTAKKAVDVFSTDWHIEKDDQVDVRSLILKQAEIALELGLNRIWCLGDVFKSRIAQPLASLMMFKYILDDLFQLGITLYVFPGNHDKVLLGNNESYLDAFASHPAIKLMNNIEMIEVQQDLYYTVVPYFPEKYIIEILSQFEHKDAKHVLLGHFAADGAMNNDGSLVTSEIGTDMLKKFDRVMLGHYHNRNGRYIGSLAPRNFSEDDQKGYVILYDDSSVEYVNSTSKKYITREVRCDSVDVKELAKIEEELSELSKTDNVRLVVSGPKQFVESVNFKDLKDVKVVVKFDEVAANMDKSADGQIVKFETEDIKNEFKTFCDENQLDYQEGMKYLSKCL